MKFDQLSSKETKIISVVKQKIQQSLQEIFYDNRRINQYVVSKQISKENAIKILIALEKYNKSTCICCPQFKTEKLSRGYILESEFQPLIDAIKADVTVQIELLLKQQQQQVGQTINIAEPVWYAVGVGGNAWGAPR